jgi:hypothetical protein
VLFGVLCILGSVIWRQESRDDRERLLIFQLGQSITGAVGSSTKPLADLVAELFIKENQLSGLGADMVRDLGIALLISAFVTF